MKVEGFFRTLKGANDAISALKSKGIDKAFLDLKDDYMVEQNIHRNIAGTEEATSLSDLVMHSGNIVYEDVTKAPIGAANPMVSGIAGFEEITDYNFKIVAEVEEQNQHAAKHIISQMGGETEDPNIH
ncbi:hypothetical protein [Alkaliphilus transvaalensis]|uniref:hypothetical protein n=1 Tax=Alkaliphilus transvaalensis TaxID=114628 RepID=UPI00054F860D|nr:hypothetical protein [Alkaliphilus transvaalensis]